MTDNLSINKHFQPAMTHIHNSINLMNNSQNEVEYSQNINRDRF